MAKRKSVQKNVTVKKSSAVEKSSADELEKALKTGEAKDLMKDLKENAPPLEELAREELEEISRLGKVLAGKAEAYYLGYLRGTPSPGGEVADAGITIVAVVAGSTAATVAGQIVGKKMDGSINIREQLINPEMFRAEIKNTEQLGH